jgi:hypothetical protein
LLRHNIQKRNTNYYPKRKHQSPTIEFTDFVFDKTAENKKKSFFVNNDFE